MYFFKITAEDIFQLLLEKEEGWGWRERKRTINVREKLVGCLLVLGIRHATRLCTLNGNQNCDLSVSGTLLLPIEPHWPGLKLKVF